MIKPLLTLACVLPLLTACGETRVERIGSGAVIGGAVGGIGGFICCIDPTVGFYGGAAVGGLIGGLSPEPIFFNHHDDDWPYGS